MSDDIIEVPDVSTMDVTEAVRACATLADLTVHMWSGERTDAKIGEKLKEDANAVGNTGRYVKNLFAGVDGPLKTVRSAHLTARTTHFQLTLPWITNPHASSVGNARLLPNALFLRYVTEMNQLKAQAADKLEVFLDEYPDLCQQARANLGALARLEDYPDPDVVRKAFRLTFDFTPIPPASAFQGLPETVVKKLGATLKQRQALAVQAAQAAMWGRVRESVGHLIDRLAEPDTKFKPVTVEQVRELIGLLPGFNCAGDDRVADVVEDIKQMLTGVDAKMLREEQPIRDSVVRQARVITDKLNQWGL